MKTSKTLSDLRRRLQRQFDSLVCLERVTDDFNDLEVAEIVNDAQREALRFGGPLVSDEQAVATPRDGMAIIGKLLAWTQATAPAVLTVQQAAERLGVSPRTVYDLVEVGDLKCQRVGTGRGTIRIRPADLDKCNSEQESRTSKLRHIG